MKYISQINAFYIWLETNELSQSARHLWHALMHTANRTGWQPSFAIAVSSLVEKTGIEKRTLFRARNELKQAGRIDWTARSGNQSAIYSIIPFPDQCDDLCVTQSVTQPVTLSDTHESMDIPDTQPVTQPVTQYVVQPVTQPVTITRQRQDKDKDKDHKTCKTRAKTTTKGLKEPKVQFAEFVSLSQSEYDKLVQEIGEPATLKAIDIINSYKGASGRKYASDYLAMRNWTLDRVRKDHPELFRASSKPQDPTANPFEGWEGFQ